MHEESKLTSYIRQKEQSEISRGWYKKNKKHIGIKGNGALVE